MKFEKFLRNEKKNKIIETPTRKFTCYEYEEKWHVKSELPTLEKKGKRTNKIYVAWNDNEESSSSDSESE